MRPVNKESKNSGGAMTDWKNLLLACVYCNSRKKEQIKKEESNLCIWPDENNTFLAYSYENEIPRINQLYLMGIGKTVHDRAKKLFDIVILNNIPTDPKDKDKRWKTRIEVLGIAESLYDDWLSMKDTIKNISVG